ncbi:SecDF P1 head subdomain-containing protein [Streptomyces marincola]|uniref:SecDF P1 head subdomain-containing protein n=1 Tax=Streptomyces marincola TaxID=2878388 RepID=UPI001CF361D6|nr:hypothetical protein [Streptomyces marincola]UCM89633.1 hypothetical protein LC193_17695 [Streptomyces marincola]
MSDGAVGPVPGGERLAGPFLVTVALVLLGSLLTFLALRSADGRHAAGAGFAADARPPAAGAAGPLAHPLRFVPVQAQMRGACGAASGETVRSPETGDCLTLAADAGFEVERLRTAEARLDADGGWLVSIAFLPEDAVGFGELTARTAVRRPPGNQLAVVLDGRLLTSPAVTGRIDGGAVDIRGAFSRAEAHDLAEQLRG